jgi:hypothetical protein
VKLPASFDDGRVRFDPDFADRLVGKVVLIGVTYEDFRGNVKGQEQFFGTVKTVDPKFGITLSWVGSALGARTGFHRQRNPLRPLQRGNTVCAAAAT